MLQWVGDVVIHIKQSCDQQLDRYTRSKKTDILHKILMVRKHGYLPQTLDIAIYYRIISETLNVWHTHRTSGGQC